MQEYIIMIYLRRNNILVAVILKNVRKLCLVSRFCDWTKFLWTWAYTYLLLAAVFTIHYIRYTLYTCVWVVCVCEIRSVAYNINIICLYSRIILNKSRTTKLCSYGVCCFFFFEAYARLEWEYTLRYWVGKIIDILL